MFSLGLHTYGTLFPIGRSAHPLRAYLFRLANHCNHNQGYTKVLCALSHVNGSFFVYTIVITISKGDQLCNSWAKDIIP